MNWLDEQQWQSRIHIGGWVTGTGGDYAVTEPATGKELTRLGQATPADVAAATARAAEAQKQWAALPYDPSGRPACVGPETCGRNGQRRSGTGSSAIPGRPGQGRVGDLHRGSGVL